MQTNKRVRQIQKVVEQQGFELVAADVRGHIRCQLRDATGVVYIAIFGKSPGDQRSDKNACARSRLIQQRDKHL